MRAIGGGVGWAFVWTVKAAPNSAALRRGAMCWRHGAASVQLSTPSAVAPFVCASRDAAPTFSFFFLPMKRETNGRSASIGRLQPFSFSRFSSFPSSSPGDVSTPKYGRSVPNESVAHASPVVLRDWVARRRWRRPIYPQCPPTLTSVFRHESIESGHFEDLDWFSGVWRLFLASFILFESYLVLDIQFWRWRFGALEASGFRAILARFDIQLQTAHPWQIWKWNSC